MPRAHYPANAFDLADVLAPDGHCPRLLWLCHRHSLTLGPSYAFRGDDGRALAIGGLCHNLPHVREAWFAVRPEAAAHIRALVRDIRWTLQAQCQHDPRPVIAFVRTEAGARIARLIGMTQTGARRFEWRAQCPACSITGLG